MAHFASHAFGEEAKSGKSIVNGELGTKLDEHVNKIVKDNGFSGTVLVAKGGTVLLHKGYGLADRDKQWPMELDTASSIGSNTKCFTAAAILKLEEMKKLGVDWPITKFFDNVPADKQSITIHHMLTHSSGLGEYHDKPGEGGDFAEMTRDEAVKRIFAQELRCKPGEKMAYSNCGFTILAVIIEKASGQTWEQFLRENLFKPAGMEKTGFYGEKLWKDQEIAKGYGRNHKADDRPSNWPGVTWALKGGGGIVSTAGDMNRWHAALNGDSVLSSASKEKAFKIHVAEGARAGEGYGWIVLKTPRNTTALNTGGGNDFGFTAGLMRYVEEDAIISVMSNNGQCPAGDVLDGLPRLLFPAK